MTGSRWPWCCDPAIFLMPRWQLLTWTLVIETMEAREKCGVQHLGSEPIGLPQSVSCSLASHAPSYRVGRPHISLATTLLASRLAVVTTNRLDVGGASLHQLKWASSAAHVPQFSECSWPRCTNTWRSLSRKGLFGGNPVLHALGTLDWILKELGRASHSAC